MDATEATRTVLSSERWLSMGGVTGIFSLHSLICANKLNFLPSMSSIVNFLAENGKQIFADLAKKHCK
jgi:hypothetical protein